MLFRRALQLSGPAAMAALLLGMSSCINEDYDLTKNFNTDIGIEGDISAPLGSTEVMLIGDFLDLDSGNDEVLKTDPETGDYYISIAGSGNSTSINIPDFSIDGALVSGGGFHASVKKSEIFPGGASGTIPQTVLTSAFKPTGTPIQVNQSISSEIIDIRDIAASGTVTVNFRTNAGKVRVSDLKLTFPEYLKIGRVTGTGASLNGSVLTFSSMDVATTSSSFTIEMTGIDFTKIPSGQGFLRDSHRIFLDDSIELSEFYVTVDTGDFGSTAESIPESIDVDIDINLPKLTVESASVKVDPQVDLQSQVVSVGELPEFITGQGVVLDLYNPQINIDINNQSPLTLGLNADITSYKESANLATVHIGADGSSSATAPISIVAGGRSSFCISRTGEDVPSGYTSIVVPGLKDIMSQVPDEIGIENLDVEAADEFITVRTSANYAFSYDYSVKAPLAFGEDLNIVYHSDIDGWNEDLGLDGEDFSIDVENAELTFTLQNTIPLQLALTADAIDVNDNVLSGVSVELNGEIEAGSVTSPSVKPMTINIKASNEEMRKLDGLRFNIEADSPMSGVCLNKAQGVQFKDMKIRLQAKAVFELK